MTRPRPDVLEGRTHKVASGCGTLYITVNRDKGGIREVFAQLGKSGGCVEAQLEAMCRLASLILRSGIEVDKVVKHLKGIRCPVKAVEKGVEILSCPDAIAYIIQKEIDDGNPVRADKAGEAGEPMLEEQVKDEATRQGPG